MDRKGLIGQDALVCFREGGRFGQVFGRITAFDDFSISVRTEENHLLIPTHALEKIKARIGGGSSV
jgi:hypothetical protein